MLRAVEENPGLTAGEVAARIGKKDHYVDTLLWRLKKYTGALRIEVTGYASPEAAARNSTQTRTRST
jgi:hypothetical protein